MSSIIEWLQENNRQSALENYAKNFSKMSQEDKLSGLAQFAPDAYLRKIGENLDAGDSQAAAKERAGIFADQPKPLAQLPQGEMVSQYLLGDARKNAGAIGQIESNNNYNEVGPMTKHGRALGKYQVMEENVPSWTKEALGQELTPEQFLASKQAQDQVFAHHFGKSVEKFGNPQDAASVWFTGRPQAQGANASDLNGVTGSQYVDRFNSALGQLPTSQPQASPQVGLASYASAQPQTMTDAPSDSPLPDTPQQQLTPPPQVAQNTQNASQPKKMQDIITQLSNSKLKENRELGKKLEEKYLQKQFDNEDAPPEIKTVDNPDGTKSSVQWDKQNKQWKPVVIPGQTAQQDNGLEGQDYLQSLPKPEADKYQGYLDGRVPPPRGFNPANQQGQLLLSKLARIDPGFDLTKWKARNDLRSEFANGKSGIGLALQSMGQFSQHLQSAYDKIDDLGNYSTPFFNEIINPIEKKTSGDFQEKINRLDTDLTAVSTEMAKILRGSGVMSEKEAQDWKQKFDLNAAPQAQKGVLSEAADLVHARFNEIANRWNTVMGGEPKTADDFFSPEAMAAYKKVKGLEDVRNKGNQISTDLATPDNEGWQHAGVINGQPVKIRLKK